MAGALETSPINLHHSSRVRWLVIIVLRDLVPTKDYFERILDTSLR
jgi:hypothetical protein